MPKRPTFDYESVFDNYVNDRKPGKHGTSEPLSVRAIALKYRPPEWNEVQAARNFGKWAKERRWKERRDEIWATEGRYGATTTKEVMAQSEPEPSPSQSILLTDKMDCPHCGNPFIVADDEMAKAGFEALRLREIVRNSLDEMSKTGHNPNMMKPLADTLEKLQKMLERNKLERERAEQEAAAHLLQGDTLGEFKRVVAIALEGFNMAPADDPEVHELKRQMLETLE